MSRRTREPSHLQDRACSLTETIDQGRIIRSSSATQVLLRRNNWVRFEKRGSKICTGPKLECVRLKSLATYFPITVQLVPLYQTMTLLAPPAATAAPHVAVLESVI